MELERRALTGLTWTSGARLLQQVAQLAATIVIARLLSPAHFGIVAVAAACVAFLALLAEFGFGAALVQYRGLRDIHLSSVFWAALTASILLIVVGVIAAPWIADFIGEPELGPVTRVLSCSLLFTGAGIVPRAVLQRRLAFADIARIETGAVLMSALIAVTLASLGAGLWSIIAQILVVSVCATAGFFVVSAWRPRRSFSFQALRDLARVGVGIAGFNAVNYGARNFDDLIVGRLLGTYALGLYGRAYMLMLLPITQVSAAIGGVLLPAMSAARDRPAEARQLYLRVVEIAALMALPMLAGTLVVADSLVPVLFGAQWVEMVPVLRILCLVGSVQVLLAPAGYIYQAFGATRLLFGWGVLASTVTIASFVIGAWYGSIEAVAWCYLAAHLILVWPGVAIPGRLIGLDMAEFARSLRRPAAAAAGMAAVVSTIGLLIDHRLAPLAMLTVQVSTGVLTYAALVSLLCRGPVVRLWSAWRTPGDAAPAQLSHAMVPAEGLFDATLGAGQRS